MRNTTVPLALRKEHIVHELCTVRQWPASAAGCMSCKERKQVLPVCTKTLTLENIVSWLRSVRARCLRMACIAAFVPITIQHSVFSGVLLPRLPHGSLYILD